MWKQEVGSPQGISLLAHLSSVNMPEKDYMVYHSRTHYHIINSDIMLAQSKLHLSTFGSKQDYLPATNFKSHCIGLRHVSAAINQLGNSRN